MRRYVPVYRECRDSVPVDAEKISIFKVFRVSEMSDCHPFATRILKNITEHKKSTEPVELNAGFSAFSGLYVVVMLLLHG